jgi:hypothetical protein
MRWTKMVHGVLTRLRRVPLGGLETARWSPMKRFVGLVTIIVFSVSGPSFGLAQQQGAVTISSATESAPAVRHDVSRPLRSLPHAQRPVGPPLEIPLRPFRPSELQPVPSDPVVQQSAGSAIAVTAGLGFDGIGTGNPNIPDYVVNSAPADPNGAPGIDQYVQWVNTDLAVFDKGTGAILYGPAPGNTLWNEFGGPCETENDGDPIVQYDKAANRWVLTQFAVKGSLFYQCVAVSTTPDATESYNRFAFQYPNFNDYSKLAVWPDAYYVSSNMFKGGQFVGPRVCAYDRAAMLGTVERPVTQQCFQLSSAYGGLLPSDLDGFDLGGTNAPPAGSPNFFLALGSNVLQLWKFHVDWTTPSNSTLAGPTTIPVANFSEACNGGVCIPQPGTKQQLDSLGDRLMYRLAYRHFSDGHEALVTNHSVNPSGNVVSAPRWYELVNPPGQTMADGTPVLAQQGTYAPDSTDRWMGSIAMDKVGNLALGYSVSSDNLHPGIRYTGRAPGDSSGVLAIETSIQEGTGSQTRSLSRWGDYSAMTIDPTDDCTFWYTNQYLKTDGKFNWSTRIASFKFASCH